MDDPIVCIRRQWNDYRIGKVRLSQLSNPRWDNISGGAMAPAPQMFIHGYVWCNEVEGEIAHSCSHGAGPHKIKVCVVKKDNEPEVFKRLLEIVGPKPKLQKKKPLTGLAGKKGRSARLGH
jgi:hypothetical protein